MTDMKKTFDKIGYVHLKDFFTDAEIAGIKDIVLESNEKWIAHNAGVYETVAVNSAYLTSSKYCHEVEKRDALFRFIGSEKLIRLAGTLIGSTPYFKNTQLFFNPKNRERKPYWHRDIQYSGLSEAMQKDRILLDRWLHFRVPLYDDPGLEFVPGSHIRWDKKEERAVRLELNGRKNHENLHGTVVIPHKPGDLLVFSAHLIHKGIYGGERKSFDILFGDAMETSDMAKSHGHFPEEEILKELKNKEVFQQCKP